MPQWCISDVLSITDRPTVDPHLKFCARTIEPSYVMCDDPLSLPPPPGA